MNIISTSAFNTNNGWGFGGSIGKSEIFDNGLTVITARNCHRHTGTSCGNCVYVAVEEGENPFKVKLYTAKRDVIAVKNLKGVETISVLKSSDNYQALVGDYETFERWGLTYTRIKTITLNKMI